MKLNSIDEGKFEEELKKRLWSQIVTHFLDEIYLPSEENASSASEFNTLGLDDQRSTDHLALVRPIKL